MLVSTSRDASASIGGPAGYAIHVSLRSDAQSQIVTVRLSMATKDGLTLVASPSLRLGADGATSVAVQQPSAHYRISVRPAASE